MPSLACLHCLRLLRVQLAHDESFAPTQHCSATSEAWPTSHSLPNLKVFDHPQSVCAPQNVCSWRTGCGQGQVPSGVVVKRFWRPEDISAEKAYTADWWEVYASDEERSLHLDDVLSKCRVVAAGHPSGLPSFWTLCFRNYATLELFAGIVYHVLSNCRALGAGHALGLPSFCTMSCQNAPSLVLGTPRVCI